MGLRSFAARTSLPLGTTILDNTTTTARWLHTVSADTTRMSLRRLVDTREFSILFREMREDGRALRREVGYDLNRRFGLNIMPDADDILHFSQRTIVRAACDHEGIHLSPADEYLRNLGTKLAGTGRPVYAWMRTWPDQRQPDMSVDVSIPEAAYTFHVAALLGQYLRDVGQYRGPGAPDVIILPADPYTDAPLCALTHQFAKGLLRLDRMCAPGAPCQCNRILALYDSAPPKHPDVTGALPPYVHRPVNNTTGRPKGERLQEWRRERTGNTDPNSRAL